MNAASVPQPTSNTPILDRLAPVPAPDQPIADTKPRLSKFGKFTGILFFVTLGVVIWNSWLGRTLGDLTLGRGPVALVLLFVWVVLPFLAGCAAVLAHELGHLIAGWSVGFRLVSIRVGMLELAPPFRLSLSHDHHPKELGFTQMIPLRNKALRIRTAVMLVGGSIANIFCCWVAIELMRGGSVFLSWFALLSLIFGICSLIPLPDSDVKTDADRLFMLLKSGGTIRRNSALAAIASDLKNGVAPEDFKPELITALTAVRDNSPLTASAHLLAYARAYYVCSPDEAAHLLETALQYSQFLSPRFREALFCDAGIFQAEKRKRTDLARDWLGEVSETPAAPDHRLRVEASILDAQGDYRAALLKVDEIEARLRKNKTDGPQLATALRLLDRRRSELKEKLAGVQSNHVAR